MSTGKAVIIAGTHGYSPAQLRKQLRMTDEDLVAMVESFGADVDTVFQGGCPTGADAWAREAFKGRAGWTLETFGADWDEHKQAAGPIRNREMAKHPQSVGLLAVWDGLSPGTRDMVWAAERARLKFRHVRLSGTRTLEAYFPKKKKGEEGGEGPGIDSA